MQLNFHRGLRASVLLALLVLVLSTGSHITSAMQPSLTTNSAPSSPYLTPALQRGPSNLSPATLGAQLKTIIPPSSATATTPRTSPTLDRTARQQNAIRQLHDRHGDGLKIRLRPGNQTVMQIRGATLATPGGTTFSNEPQRDRDTARSFLSANRDLLRLNDPDHELRVADEQQDDLGYRHLKFDQTYQGLPVWPAGLAVHLEPHGNVYLVDGAYVPTPAEVAITPVLHSAEAILRAKSTLAGPNPAQTGEPTLIIHGPLDKPPRLAWKFNLTKDALHSWVMVVDALDGRILSKISQVMDANVTASAVDLLGKTRPVNVWSQDGKFFMFDTSKPMFKAGTDPSKLETAGVIRILDGQDKTTDAALESSALITSTDASTWLPDAVSAAFNFSLTYDYYLKHHNRNSLDAQGGSILAIVRVADQKHNAAWIGQYGLMVFGDDIKLAAGLDVIGHELTHGITEKTAGLIYQDQAGALNEAMSDIFGEFVEASRDGQPDWQIGEEIDFVIRNFKDPGAVSSGQFGRLPGKMSEYKELPPDTDNGGVHINSSIINHACYLLAVGLNGAIGISDSEKIFYRCLTQNLQKQSQFIDARLGCIAAAETLFGATSTQAKMAAEAFDAVEIFETPPTPAPAPIPTVQGPDSTLLIGFDPFAFETALGRREVALSDPVDGVALVESVKAARPAVSGDGSFALFVDSANDLCGVDTDDPNSLQCLGFPGLVHSVALSPNGQLAAFVLRDPTTGIPQNKINVVDLVKNSTKTLNLLSPVADGASVDDVLYADSMVFTPDSSQLVYDAAAQMHFAGGPAVLRWSIFAFDLTTETTVVLLPPQQGFDTGNPNIGRAGNRFLTFDARDVTTLNTTVVNLDLFTGKFAVVGNVGQGLGYPCFTGDETALVYATQDRSATFTGFSLVQQALGPDRLTSNGQPTLWLADAAIGVIYRRGTFVSSNAPPQVHIISPTEGQTFTIPGSFTLEAAASDSDGQIARVEFYDGADKLQEVTAPPYRLSVSFDQSATPHQFRLIARATDNIGAVTDSATVAVTVGQNGGGGTLKIAASLQQTKAVRLVVSAPTGSYTIQQSKDLINWVDIYPVNVGPSGTGSVDDLGGPANNSPLFYRVRKN